MQAKKKDLPTEDTQLLSSDQNQLEPNSNHRPIIRDAAMAAAGVAAGVAGSTFVHALSTDDTIKTTTENTVSATTHDTATDHVNENVKPEASPTPEEVVLTTANGANVAHVDNSLSFGEAFADARNQVGPGGVFSYNGQLYNTYYKEEWNNMTSDQKNEYYASVSLPENSHVDTIHPQSAPEPIHEVSYSAADAGTHSSGDEIYVLGVGSATFEGQEVYVAHLSAGGEDVVLLDIDKDGTFDYAVADVNSDGAISQDEVHDISQHHITVDQMQAASQPEPNVFVQDTNMPDYTNDADISQFA